MTLILGRSWNPGQKPSYGKKLHFLASMQAWKWTWNIRIKVWFRWFSFRSVTWFSGNKTAVHISFGRSWRAPIPGCAPIFRLHPEVSRWWFQIFFYFTPTWGRFPIWLIFFKSGWNHHIEAFEQRRLEDDPFLLGPSAYFQGHLLLNFEEESILGNPDCNRLRAGG